MSARYSDRAVYRRVLREARPYWRHISGDLSDSACSRRRSRCSGPLPSRSPSTACIGRPLPGFLDGILPGLDSGTRPRAAADLRGGLARRHRGLPRSCGVSRTAAADLHGGAPHAPLPRRAVPRTPSGSRSPTTTARARGRHLPDPARRVGRPVRRGRRLICRCCERRAHLRGDDRRHRLHRLDAGADRARRSRLLLVVLTDGVSTRLARTPSRR